MRRALLALFLAAALIGPAAVAIADVPTGPRLAFIQVGPLDLSASSNHPAQRAPGSFGPTVDLLTTGPLGEQPFPLLTGHFLSGLSATNGLSWSPDGSTLAFGGSNGFNGTPPLGDIYLVSADGSGLHQLTHLGDASYPVFSADAKTIYFVRINRGSLHDTLARLGKTVITTRVKIPSTSIWAIGVDGTGLRQLTPSAKHVTDQPDSVSPLTGELAFTRIVSHHRKRRYSVHLLSPTGTDTPLEANATSAAFSPNGQRLALVSKRDHNWPKHPAKHHALGHASELYVLDPASGSLQRLTHTRGVFEATPSWDPSGQRIAFLRFGLGGIRLMETNADGSCQFSVFGKPKDLFRGPIYLNPTWQPGPGRGAGRIAC